MTPDRNLTLGRHQFARDALARHAGSLPAPLVFDAGAGDGALRDDVARLQLQWRGFDRSPRDGVAAWDLDRPCPVDEKAGAVLLLDVIEHLRNPALALSNVAAALRPQGLLVVSTPNPRWSRSRLDALMHGVPTCFTEDDLARNGHLFPLWPHVLFALLAEAGFARVEYVTLDGRTGLPGRPYSLRYPLRLARALATMTIERLDRSACGMSYAMLARKT